MTIRNFGKEISLQVFHKGANGDEIDILKADGLRVDFDIMIREGYSKARFDIYNLSNTTIKDVSNEERFIRISTKLHDQEYTSLGDDFYVSNVFTETKLPNSITSFFCMTGRRRTFLEHQVDVTSDTGTIEDYLKVLVGSAKEASLDIKLVLFPESVKSYKPHKDKLTRFSGSVEKELKRLSIMYHFDYFLGGGNLILTYRGDTGSTYESSGLKSDPTTFNVDVVEMRANPIVGAGTLQLELNLRPQISPGDIIDTENFITASPANQDLLTAAKNKLKANVTQYSRYQVYNINHKGSNFTDKWNTTISATTASDGNRLSRQQFNWYGRS